MNLVELCLAAQFCWESVEPDGSICYQCGGECLLKMFRLFAKFKPMNDMKTKIDTNVVMCESCRKIGE